MQFCWYADGSVTVDRFDDEIEITRELLSKVLLNKVDPAVMTVSQDHMHVVILGEDYYAFFATVETVSYRHGHLKVPAK